MQLWQQMCARKHAACCCIPELEAKAEGIAPPCGGQVTMLQWSGMALCFGGLFTKTYIGHLAYQEKAKEKADKESAAYLPTKLFLAV